MVKVSARGLKNSPYYVTVVSTYPPDKCGVASYTFGLIGGMHDFVNLRVVANKLGGSFLNDLNVDRCWKKGSIFFPLSIFFGCLKSGSQLIHLQHHYVLYGGSLDFPRVSFSLNRFEGN